MNFLLRLLPRRRDPSLKAIAKILEAENTRLREENLKLHTLCRSLRDVNEHLDKRLLAEAQR